MATATANNNAKRLRRQPVPVTAEIAPIVPVRMSSVPDRSVADRYISRSFEGGLSEFDLFDYAIEHDINVLVEGPTGPGKTMAFRAYAAMRKMHFYAVPSNVGVEPSQLFGKYIPNEERKSESDPAFVWVDGPVTDIIRYGGALLVNEVNFLPPRVKTVIFQLLDDRREISLLDHKGEVVRAHRPNCWCDLDAKACRKRWVLIGADMNPDYEGTIALNKAFRNRFGLQLIWDYDPNVEIKLIEGTTIRDLAANIRQEHRDGNIETPVSTNMLEEFEKLAKDLGVPFAIANFVAHFASDERPAIKQVFDAALENLRNEYKAKKGTAATPVANVNDQFDFSGIADDDDVEWISS